MSKKYMVALLVVGTMLCGCLLLGTSYASYQVEEVQMQANEIQFGCFNMGWQELEGYNIYLPNTYPKSDGTSANPYAVTITNNCTSNSSPYSTETKILIDTLKGNTLDDSYIMVAMQEGGNAISAPVLLSSKDPGDIQASDTETQNAYILTTTNIAPGESKTYRVWMWIRSDADNTINQAGLIFNSKIAVYTEVIE